MPDAQPAGMVTGWISTCGNQWRFDADTGHRHADPSARQRLWPGHVGSRCRWNDEPGRPAVSRARKESYVCIHTVSRSACGSGFAAKDSSECLTRQR